MPELVSLELTKSQSKDLQAELERGFGNVPELESVETIEIPNSELRGVHLVLKEGNELNCEQLVSGLVGEEVTRKSTNRLVFKTPLIIVDNMPKYTQGIPHLPSSQLSQPLHHDAMGASRVLDLYHPSLKQPHTTYEIPRRSPTLVSDPKIYWPAFAKFVRENVYTEGGKMPESGLIVKLVEKAKKTQGQSFYSGREEVLAMQISKYLNLPLDSFEVNFIIRLMGHFFDYNDEYHKKYEDFLQSEYKSNLLTHTWKPEQVLILDNLQLVHGRGAIPENLKDEKRDEPMLRGGSISDFLDRKPGA